MIKPIALLEVLAWIKPLAPGIKHYYTGRIDKTKERALCVYDPRKESAPAIGLGTKALESSKADEVRVLIRGTESKAESSALAWDLWANILEADRPTIGAAETWISPGTEPVDVTGDGRVWEYYLSIKINHQ